MTITTQCVRFPRRTPNSFQTDQSLDGATVDCGRHAPMMPIPRIPIPRAKCPDRRILHGLFGIFAIAEQMQRVAAEPVVVPVNEHRKRFAIALAHLPDYVRVGGAHVMNNPEWERKVTSRTGSRRGQTGHPGTRTAPEPMALARERCHTRWTPIDSLIPRRSLNRCCAFGFGSRQAGSCPPTASRESRPGRHLRPSTHLRAHVATIAPDASHPHTLPQPDP